MMVYGYQAVEQFPKAYKVTLGARILNGMELMLELSIEVNKKYQRQATLTKLDVSKEKLAGLLRVATKTKAGPGGHPVLPVKKYGVLSEMLVEIGKMIGGLIKSTQQRK